MLNESFIFLPGIQEKTEKMLWEQGIATWDHLLDATAIRGVSSQRLSFWKSKIRQLRCQLEGPDYLKVLHRLLGTRHSWRACKDLLREPRFLDIETTEYCNDITVIGVSDGEFYQGFVKGRNMDPNAMRRVFHNATCIVTFNGASFDLPIIERNFPALLPDVPHLDMRHICRQAGLTGGLKRIERQLQISRASAIRETDGSDAILLWYRHIHGDREALKDLVDYNAADVLNLLPLLETVVPPLWQNVRHAQEFNFPSVPEQYS